MFVPSVLWMSRSRLTFVFAWKQTKMISFRVFRQTGPTSSGLPANLLEWRVSAVSMGNLFTRWSQCPCYLPLTSNGPSTLWVTSSLHGQWIACVRWGVCLIASFVTFFKLPKLIHNKKRWFPAYVKRTVKDQTIIRCYFGKTRCLFTPNPQWLERQTEIQSVSRYIQKLILPFPECHRIHKHKFPSVTKNNLRKDITNCSKWVRWNCQRSINGITKIRYY